MNAIEIIAAAKAIKKPAITKARKGLAIGKHDVEFMLKVAGSINVGRDYETNPAITICYKKALAALYHYSGCTGPAGIKLLHQALKTAAANDTDSGTVLAELCPMVDRVEKEVIEPMLKSLETLKCKGKVTTSLTYETVS